MRKILLALIAAGMMSSALPTQAASVGGVLKSTVGVITGTIYGAFWSGPARGSYRKIGDWSEALSDELGGGTLSKAVGYPVGAFAGSIVGGLVGMVNGAANGIMYGISDPLSDENYSVAGASYGDYDPFDFNY